MYKKDRKDKNLCYNKYVLIFFSQVFIGGVYVLGVYYVFFGVGLGYTVISTVIGNLFDISEFGDDFMPEGLSFLKPAVIACYVTVFGGVGIILFFKDYDVAITFLVAQFLAICSANVLNKYVIKPLSKAQNTSSAELHEMIGVVGKVTESIAENGFGKITFVIKDNTISSPAKSVDNSSIPANSSIKIVSIEKNIFYVEKTDRTM